MTRLPRLILVTRWTVLLAAVLLLITRVLAQGDILIVHASEVIGPINPHVYGVNYGPWGLVSIDMQPLAAQSSVTHARFPGGRWGDENTVARQQVDLFMTQAQAWGMDVSISARLEGGTPEEAAELVRYVNIEREYDVRHWSIGNEPDLFRDYTIDRYNTEWRAIALAMREVDPSILLIGPEVSQFPPTPDGDEYLNVRREWVRGFLQANGDLVDIVSVHRYPFPRGNNLPATTALDLRDNTWEWDGLVRELRTVITETTGRDLPIAITEVNSHWNRVIGGEGTPDSRYHAIWWADVLGRLIRQRVDLVNYFTLSSFGDLGGYGLLDRYAPRPTFYVYDLYAMLGDQLLRSESLHGLVTITAALREDGKLTLMLINSGFENVVIPLNIQDMTDPLLVEIWRIESDEMVDADAAPFRIEPDPWDNGDEIVVPRMSINLYVIDDAG